MNNHYRNVQLKSKIFKFMKPFRISLFLLLFFPLNLYASIIESTMGTAVINDATAAYYNPAALMLLKNPQVIALGSYGDFHTQFTGKSTIPATGFSESGISSSNTNYFLPSFYLAVPTTDRITLGLSMMANSAIRDADEFSILRYVESSNNIQDYNIVPAIEFKINKYFSLGAGIKFSYANITLNPTTRFPGSNSADSNSENRSDGTAVGANVGFLLKLSPATVIGFAYHSAENYQLSGTSVLNGTQQIVSNNYHFQLSTPARSIFSINHFLTPKLGLFTTIQYIQWSILQNIDVYGIATQLGNKPSILNASIPYHLHDSWVVTLGNHYRFTPKWVVRFAASYVESPGNPNYQITTGDSVILGTSMGYNINKYITVDGGYAHAFIQNQNTNIVSNRILINGVNAAARDAVSLKVTFNIV